MKKSLLTSALRVFPSVFVLFGCTGNAELESATEGYTERLERVLGIDVELEESTPRVFPSQANLKIAIPAVEINLREFYAVKHCGLGALVAQRNTALGKAHLPSQRFLYEQALLATFDDCANGIASLRPELASKLQEYKALKAQQFGDVWRNMMLQSDEVYSAFTRKAAFIDTKSRNVYQQSIQDWKLLIKLNNTNALNKSVDAKELENTLKRISEVRLLASLWASQSYLVTQLTALNKSLPKVINEIQCKTFSEKEKATILRNVFSLFFVEKIQPLGSTINWLNYELSGVYKDIKKASFHDDFYSIFYLRSNTEFESYRKSMSDHVVIWQQLFERCGLSPSR